MSWSLSYHGKVASARQAITAQRKGITGLPAAEQAILNSTTELVLLAIAKEPSGGSVSISASGSGSTISGENVQSVSVSIVGAYP